MNIEFFMRFWDQIIEQRCKTADAKWNTLVRVSDRETERKIKTERQRKRRERIDFPHNYYCKRYSRQWKMKMSQ